MAIERLAPDAILASTSLSGAVTDIQDDPDSPDGNWLTAANNNVATDVRVSFPSPSGSPRTGAGLQEFRALVRKSATSGTGTPTARIELWENGALIAAGGENNVTSTTGQVIAYTWNAASLGTADGSLVECKVVGTQTGGKTTARAAVDVGAAEWNADAQAAAQTVSPSGVASTEAFGAVTVTPGSVTVSPTGIPSAEAFGTATVSQPGGTQTVSPTGIASTEAFGAVTVAPGPVTVSLAGIASAEAFGTPAASPGPVTVSPAGIASAEGFGTPTVTPGVVLVSPAGIASAESFGAPVVTPGPVAVSPAGIASAAAFGIPTVEPGPVTVAPAGIASAETFGNLTVTGGELTATIHPLPHEEWGEG